jgi:hypothetical protein
MATWYLEKAKQLMNFETFQKYHGNATFVECYKHCSGADPGFQVRGPHLKKLKIVGVFRVKNHDFTPKNLIFSNFRGARAGCTPLPGSDPTADAMERLNHL